MEQPDGECHHAPAGQQLTTTPGGMCAQKKGAKGATGPPLVHLSRELYSIFDNPPLKFWKVAKKKRVRTPMTGVADLLEQLKPEPVEGQPLNPRAAEPIIKAKYNLVEETKRRRDAERTVRLQKRLALWDPHASNPYKTEDGYKTLFVARLSPATTNESLAKAMSAYGDVKDCKIVLDRDGVSRCYGFVQFASEDALQRAFKSADATAVDGATILVDVERGRTVSTWVPQRFGQGLGGPPRQKGYTLRAGRGPPEPPPKRQRIWRPRGPPPQRG